jgi:hypothetical protein
MSEELLKRTKPTCGSAMLELYNQARKFALLLEIERDTYSVKSEAKRNAVIASAMSDVQLAYDSYFKAVVAALDEERNWSDNVNVYARFGSIALSGDMTSDGVAMSFDPRKEE